MVGGFPVHRQCNRASASAGVHGSAAAFVIVAPLMRWRRVAMGDVVSVHRRCNRASALAGVRGSAAAVVVVVVAARANAADLIVHLDVGARE